MRVPIAALLPILAVVLAGCGPSTQDVLDESSADFAAMRARLAEILALIEPTGRTGNEAGLAGLDPLPGFSEETEEGNTEILMDWQLPDPDADDGGGMDLRLSGRLLRYLQWTGPQNPMSDKLKGKTAGEEFREGLRAALATRYLVVLHELSFSTPIVDVETGAYEGGFLAMEAFLVDLDEKRVLGSFPFDATAEGRVEYVYQPGENQKDRAEAWVRSRVWEIAREKLMGLLTEHTGGEFLLRD